MQSIQRSFSVNPAALALGHPYPLNPSRTLCTIHFVEFRGIGPPSPDFGQAGDVYIDLNPRQYALYWCDRAHSNGRGRNVSQGPQWKRWMALLLDKFPLHKYLVAHPWARNAETSDLFLWADPGGVTWTSKDALCASRVEMIRRNIAPVVPGVASDVAAMISHILQRILDAERSVDYSQDRRALVDLSSHTEHHYKLRRVEYSSSTLPLPSARSPSGGQHRSRPSTPFRTAPLATYPSMPVYPSTQLSREERCNQALDGMQRALKAEQKSKQELRLKSRELATLKKKEKEALGMSYLYQKREQELVAALAAAEQRSSAELQDIRAMTQALERKAQASREDTRSAIEQVRRSEEELAVIRGEIAGLQSRLSH